MERRACVDASRRVSLADRYLFMRQLHVLQKAGVPLLSSLGALEAQLPAGALKHTIQAISRDLLNGSGLSQAFARHPRSFPPLVISLLRIGEAGGLLEQMLKRLAELCEWEMELQSRLKQALFYPLIVLGVLAVGVLLMVTVVLPQFVHLFASWQLSLPWPTRLLLGASVVVTRFGWLFALLGLSGVFALAAWLRTEAGRLRWHTLQLRLPLVGPLFVQLAMARFARAMAALTASGVPVLETLALSGESVNNSYIQRALCAVQERVKGGARLAQALGEDGLFPPAVLQMVATGEETGHMDELLQSVADYYDQQAAYLLRTLVTAIEPALLIVVGVGVLVMASAVLLPWWDLVKVFKSGG